MTSTLNEGSDRSEVLSAIRKLASNALNLWFGKDFVKPPAPEMFPEIVGLARDFSFPAFQTAQPAEGPAPWLAVHTNLAYELLKTIWAVLMREEEGHDIESLCQLLVDLELEAATFVAENIPTLLSDAQVMAEELAIWNRKIETLTQRKLVLQSRSATASLKQDVADIEHLAEDVRQVAAKSREKAGEVGELGLATYFDQLAKSERRSANWFRGSAIAILVLAGALAYFEAFDKIVSTATTIRHLALILPAFGLSTYLGAEAAKHRRSAQWAETVKVQLITIGLYCAPMDTESATAVRKMLANRVFGSLPGEASDSPSQAVLTPAILEQLAALVRTNK